MHELNSVYVTASHLKAKFFHLCSCLNMLLQWYTTWVFAFANAYSVNVCYPKLGREKKPRLFLNLIDFETLEYNLKLKPLGMGVLLQPVAKKIFYSRNLPEDKLQFIYWFVRKLKDYVKKVISKQQSIRVKRETWFQTGLISNLGSTTH